MTTTRKTSRYTCLFLGVALLIVSGCSTGNGPPAETEPYDPFSSQWGLAGEDYMVKLDGYSKGHLAGHRSEFGLVLQNPAGETWETRYCAFLVDQEGVVKVLDRHGFRLDPGGRLERSIVMDLPEDFEDGPYGLVVLIPDHGAQVQSIWVGDTGLEGPAGPWPLIVSCPE